MRENLGRKERGTAGDNGNGPVFRKRFFLTEGEAVRRRVCLGKAMRWRPECFHGDR